MWLWLTLIGFEQSGMFSYDFAFRSFSGFMGASFCDFDGGTVSRATFGIEILDINLESLVGETLAIFPVLLFCGSEKK